MSWVCDTAGCKSDISQVADRNVEHSKLDRRHFSATSAICSECKLHEQPLPTLPAVKTMALTRTFMSFYVIKAARGIVNHPKHDPIVAHTKVDGPLFIPKLLPTQPPALGSTQFNSKQVFRTPQSQKKNK